MRYMLLALLFLPLMGFAQTKTDTVSVEVLCINKGVSVELRAKEQSFVQMTVTVRPTLKEIADGVYWSDLAHRTKKEWVLRSERWLEDVSGCYHLTPLSNTK